MILFYPLSIIVSSDSIFFYIENLSKIKYKKRMETSSKKNHYLIQNNNWSLAFSLSTILNQSKDIWISLIKRKDHLILFYKILSKTLESFINTRYSKFDALTTSNCCHGMSLLALDLIHLIAKHDLNNIQAELNKKTKEAELSQNNKFLLTWIPDELFTLAGMFSLNYISQMNPQKGRRTVPKVLKELNEVGTNFCEELIKKFQIIFSNHVADSYYQYYKGLDENINICGVGARYWGKYLTTNHIRKNNRGVKFAPSLFSIEISLAHLCKIKAKIAIINDLMSNDGKIRSRYIKILQGDGKEFFAPINITNPALNLYEPIVIFGGCLFSDTITIQQLGDRMEKWLTDFQSLVLAGETHYPQFPKLKNDPNFSNDPIEPEEEFLKTLFDVHRKIPGVHVKDPSLYFLTHIYPASLAQALELACPPNLSDLPYSSIYIPRDILPLNLSNSLSHILFRKKIA